MQLLWPLILLLDSVLCSASNITPAGLTVRLNDISYLISPHVTATISVDPSAFANTPSLFGLVPVSVFTNDTVVENVAKVASSWAQVDDVFQPAFLQLTLLDRVPGKHVNGSSKTVKAIKTSNSTMIQYSSNSKIPQGPFFLDKSTGDLHPIYRLYDDFAGTFNEALLQDPNGTFQTLSARIPGSATLTIGVPSRLYFEPSETQPLAGVRIAVKDIFSLAGVKKSNGNRAWYHLYPPENTTCTAISRLVAAGAVVVGTQRLSQFATSEVATVDWVDYHSPFNPRGDGYQDASSSSSGAGASIASYEWLDAAVGTDTGGSIRSPAGVNGVFGNRPSHGSVALDNVMPLSEPLDTAGFLVRDPVLWDKLQQVMYGPNYTTRLAEDNDDAPFRYPTNIWTVSWPDSTTEASYLLNDFASALAKHVNGTLETLNLTELWSDSNSEDPDVDSDLATMLNVTYPVLTGQGQVSKVIEPFLADYAALHDGRRPFIDPAPLARWAWAANYSWDEAMHNKTLFMNWFNTVVLPRVSDPAQCSSGLVLYPAKVGTQALRNRYDIDPPAPYTGFSASRMSVFCECPDFIFPIGEMPNWSSITNHEEYLPVAVGILAAKGCDGLLSRLAMDLVDAGVLQAPRVGSTLGGGAILY
ncbi:hypothetical protein PFICI_00964 [Pestalotiopsis fici W106-1]|uniref:Amidase domain-containing protein n=1 Tax=Pestalotiopsis fici (strain W106-1 / CGMCC3.15140) TaxID=1229662 RepID=W3XPF5_PESFW|nr:uncharacterized protein PFICI_00964 [Pestalotiopsis fici W106-1]ETS87136.1 hypothetical protein PFICI_00964 [Pestalotiopsis fici W106-1]